MCCTCYSFLSQTLYHLMFSKKKICFNLKKVNADGSDTSTGVIKKSIPITLTKILKIHPFSIGPCNHRERYPRYA